MFLFPLCFKSLIKITSLLVDQKRNLVLRLYLEHLEIDGGGELKMNHNWAPPVSHNAMETTTAPRCPRTEIAAERVKILHEFSIAIWDRTSADPTWNTHARRNCVISKPLDRGCWCLKTQFNIVQHYNCDWTKSGM